jgi:tetratricopeptide (TPR) repeat protein
MFFPFIGVFIAVSWGIYLFIQSFQSKKMKYISLSLCLVLIGSFANGTFLRNKVWKDAETLWKDVTVKSPNNGRGQMNYGLSLMAKGDYKNAEIYFKNSEKKSPSWYAVKINLAILNGAIGKHEIAEEYFKSALRLNISAPDPEYYYARYLFEKKQYQNALKYVNVALNKSPNHISSIQLKNKLSGFSFPIDIDISSLNKLLDQNPQNLDEFIDLSSKLYSLNRYDDAIDLCLKIIQIDSINKLAYNNLCACYNQKKQWLNAKTACEKALKIDPNFQIAKNNLNWALGSIKSQ